MRLPRIQSGFGFQTAVLFVLDGLANVIDFFFHFWMGRVLIPADFAILQTLNSVMLVYTTASGVFQPVVGRFIAEAHGKGQPDSIPGIFQSFSAQHCGSDLPWQVSFFSSQRTSRN
jgi:hypothetical protein